MMWRVLSTRPMAVEVRMRSAVHVMAIAGALLVSYGCKGSTTTPSGTPSNFLGTFAAIQGTNGTLAVKVQGAVASASVPFRLPWVATLHADSVSATGSLSLVGGGTASLSGTYDTGSKALSVSGGGYSLSGTLGGTTVTGTLTVPGGSAGAFTTMSTSSGAVTVYCSQQTTPSGEKVVWDVAVSSTGDISGSFSVTNTSAGGAGYVTGRQTGTSFTSTYVTTVGPFKGDTGTSTGTIANGVANGVDKSGASFTASTAACGTIASTIGGNPGPVAAVY